MTEELCALKGCDKPLGEEFWVVREKRYHSRNHAGQAALEPHHKRKILKERRPKEWRKLRKKFLRETKDVNWDPPEKPGPPPIVHQEFETVEIEAPWAKVKYDKKTYLAKEVVILTRTEDNGPLTMMMSGMKNVRMYLDDVGGVLLRPAQTSKTGALPAGAKLPTLALTSGSEPSVDRKEKKQRSAPVVLGGAHGLNPAKEGSKRFFLVESMIEGGSVKEIFKRAARLFHEKTGKPKSELGMVATPSNLKLMYDWLIEKLAKAGRTVAVEEDEGKFVIKDAS